MQARRSVVANARSPGTPAWGPERPLWLVGTTPPAHLDGSMVGECRGSSAGGGSLAHHHGQVPIAPGPSQLRRSRANARCPPLPQVTSGSTP